MKDQLRTRLIDLATLVVALMLGWTAYTGYIYATTFKDLITGQCSAVGQQVIDEAVAEALIECVESMEK